MDKFTTNQKRVLYITIFLIALINLVAIVHIMSRVNSNPSVNGINTVNQEWIKVLPKNIHQDVVPQSYPSVGAE